ncbi:Gfo/Idh/MocA family oxidoreductase [Brachybacterium sp. NBEC-018]|uniref:Gfo/Idh/MocA family protein n=1 Tax=Brachybacterium sp. NBEC-018 TaxID=2996004 RepID=UPI002174D42C|nr:Gfo/Idh/MocA family oxidoreductase [Brachybacterium sp. NBEC-018]UVY84460.1 Gfo/Idh/MocA family oxidoreductase [Brachybacterium sp. NBEC-018]
MMATSEPLGAAAAGPQRTEHLSSDPVGVAVIGGGTISRLHLDAYRANPDARLVTVCDIDADRARDTAAQYGAPRWTTSYEEVLADDEVTAISICTRNDTHAVIAAAALDAGKAVLVEKPLGRTSAEAQLVVDAQERSGLVAQVGFVRRFSPNAVVLKEFIEAGDLGALYYATARNLRRAGNPGGWFADKEVSGGGPLVDVGVHFIDIAWWLLGTPEVATVSGFTADRLGDRDNLRHLSRYRSADAGTSASTVEDLAGGLVRFTNGAVLSLEVSYSLHGRDDVGVKVYGDRGGAELEPELRISTEAHDTILEVTPQIDSLTFDMSAFDAEIGAFVAAVRGEGPRLAPVQDGLTVARIIEAIYASAERGREIEL